jgi:hypothetical protein
VKQFFARMSFPRGVILFCSLGSLVLGFLVYRHAQRLAEVKSELGRVKQLVVDIQTDAYRLSDLQRSASAEKFKAQSETESYIRAIAGDGMINMGQIDISKNVKINTRTTEDRVYKITPQTKGQRFSRGQIGNFLYKLEKDSRSVKVTRLKLTPYEKVAPGEIGRDQWVYEAELTTRSKVEGASPNEQG